MTLDYDSGVQTSDTFIYFLFSCYFGRRMLLIWSKNLQLCLLLVLILLKVNFGDAKISLLKI